MVAAEAAAAGCPPIVARHSGFAEVAAGLEAEYPPHLAHLASFDTGDAAGSRARLARAAALSAPDRAAIGRAARAARRALELGRRRAAPARAVRLSRSLSSLSGCRDQLPFPLHGRRAARSHDQLLREARERFEAATTSPSPWRRNSLCSIPRRSTSSTGSRTCRRRQRGTPAEPHLAGELIASEAEIKTGRVETFADVPAPIAERRAQLAALVEPLGLTLGATGTHPGRTGRTSGSSTRRTTAAMTRSSATSSGRTTPSASTSISASAAPTGLSRSRCAAELAARAARPVGQLAVRRGGQHRAAFGTDADLHPLLSALRRA